MSKKTTVKPISLGYRTVGSQESYNPVMGVLKGLTIGQDEPDSTEIEAEFYDSPFDIFYDGNPVTMTFELANYDLTDLPRLFGGEIDENDDYEGTPNAYTSEWEWKLDFGRGHSALVIYRGLTIGTLKKDADGALNYSVTITALVYNDGTTDRMYKVVGRLTPYQGRAVGSDVPFPAVLTYGEDSHDEQPQGSVKVYVDESNIIGESIYDVIGRANITTEGETMWDNIILTYSGASCQAMCQNITSVHFMGLRSQTTLAVYKTDEDEDYTINAIELVYDVQE